MSVSRRKGRFQNNFSRLIIGSLLSRLEPANPPCSPQISLAFSQEDSGVMINSRYTPPSYTLVSSSMILMRHQVEWNYTSCDERVEASCKPLRATSRLHGQWLPLKTYAKLGLESLISSLHWLDFPSVLEIYGVSRICASRMGEVSIRINALVMTAVDLVRCRAICPHIAILYSHAGL